MRLYLFLICICVAALIITCSIASSGTSYSDAYMTLDEAVERLARASDSRLGW